MHSVSCCAVLNFLAWFAPQAIGLSSLLTFIKAEGFPFLQEVEHRVSIIRNATSQRTHPSYLPDRVTSRGTRHVLV